ncbi:MAG: hypothetical protein ABSE53_04915 [Terracidiphilus sp.]|jgi:hypothetical protein
MQAAHNASTRRAIGLSSLKLVAALTVCAAFFAAIFAAPFSILPAHAQAPAAQPSTTPQAVPAAPTAPAAAPAGPASPTATAGAPDAAPSQPPATSDAAPTLSSPPLAIVPLDKSIPGAALSVAGPLQAWNGRAYITGSGTITAGDATAQVTLPYRGTLHVCASGTVKLAADTSAPSGEVPGLLIALDHGAVEMSFAASTARERNADTLLTPYFRIMIGGPNPADVKVRLGENGDTCVDNAGANAPYVAVTSVFEGGIYRVQPGQRVMFEHGSLQTVVDQEKEPCGCPPSAKSEANEFPLAESEGLAPSSPPATAANETAGAGQAATTLVYKSSEPAPQTISIPQPPASPAATGGPATPAAQAQGSQKKPGFFRKIGRFFKRIFGAE